MQSKLYTYKVYLSLLILSVITGNMAIAHSELKTVLDTVSLSKEKVEFATPNQNLVDFYKPTAFAQPNAMYATIIQGADEVIECSVQGFTVAKFILCGDSDHRLISLSGGPYNNVRWEVLGGTCSPDINNDCPNTGSCYTTIGTGQTFSLQASAVPALEGAEYRVYADNDVYYFKVKKNTIPQTFVKRDFTCGNLGRIQITNLSSAYEFSIDGGGTWQGPIFSNLAAGTYNISARLANTANTCEYPYEAITIEEQEIEIAATFVDALCNGDTGSVTVVASGVPGPYKYTLLNESGVAQEFTAFIADSTHTFSAVGFGTYTVQVETQQCQVDLLNLANAPRQNLDTSGNPIIIGADASALDASTQVNSSFGCANISSVDVILNASGGSAPYSYSVNGGAIQPSFGDPVTDSGSTTITVTSDGTYDFVITDSNGCMINASSDVETLLPPDVSVAGITGTCNNGGAKLSFNINDGRGYDLSFRENTSASWVNTQQISVASGTYSNIQVRYQQGGFECVLDLPSVTVTNEASIAGAASKIVDVTCSATGDVGGQIDFIGPFTGGSGTGYVFSVDGVNFSSTTSYTNLVAGTYTPFIRDNTGCNLELTPIEILATDPPTDIDFVQSNINCAASTTNIQLTPTSNAAIVNYAVISPINLDNGTSDTFIGLDATTSYVFQVTNANGCSYLEGFNPVVESSIRARVSSSGDLRVCNGATDGTGTFIVDGFANSFSYSISPGGIIGGPQTTAEVVLPPSGTGTYTITVTDTDTGCTDTASFDIQEAAVLDLSASTFTSMSCANGNLGAIRGTATGGWGSNNYTLTLPGGSEIGPRSNRNFGNLSQEGNYTLTVEDAEGCSDTFTFNLTAIDAPSISLDTVNSDFCHVAGTGATAVVISTAGSASAGTHQYRINGGALQASNTFSGLTPGNYTIGVVDDNGCTDSIDFTIAPQLRVNTSIEAEIPCGGTPGQIRVSVNGGYLSGAGTKSYEVSVGGGAFSTPVSFTSNNFLYDTTVDGDYVFRITDTNINGSGCVANSAPLTLAPPENIDAASVSIRPVSCGETNNGAITIIPDATSGVPPYEVNFNNEGWKTQTVYSNLGIGTYSYQIRDARGCTTVSVNQNIDLDQRAVPDATITEIPAVCASSIVSGGININAVDNGTSNFDFIVEDAAGVEIASRGNVLPSSLPISILDSSLVPGDYTIITIDDFGCTDIDTITITSNEVVIIPIAPPAPISCDDSGFTYAVNVTGGSGVYEIRLLEQTSFVALNSGPNNHTFSNVTDGIQYGVAYTVVVRDAGTGCIYEQEIPPVVNNLALDVTATSTPGACDINRNGEIAYSIANYTVGNVLEIVLVDSAGTATILESGVTTTTVPFVGVYPELPGDYRIQVTNINTNCTGATSVTIDRNLPSIDILAQVPANCNALGQVTVQGRGASGGPYEFAFVESGVAPTTFGTETTFVRPAGNYDVYIKDINGCTSFAIATVISLQPDLPVPSFNVINQCDNTATSFAISVAVPNTINTPRFSIGGVEVFPTDDGANWIGVFNVSNPGDYVVDVVDANGCTSQGTATVYDFLSASGSFTTESSCNNADGVITITTNGGSGNFSYELSGNDYDGNPITNITQNSPVFINQVPGNYQVVVTEQVNTGSGLCSFTVLDIVLNRAAQPSVVSAVATDISCNGANDGTIQVLVNADIPITSQDTPFTYYLNNNPSGTPVIDSNSGLPMSNVTGSFSGLPAGDYEVRVVTDRLCEVTTTIALSINDPVAFSITASAPDFTCSPGANRFSSTVITANASGGTVGSGYQYSITGFSNYQPSNTFEIVDDGTSQNITIYAIDGNGCQASFDVPTINPPSDVIPTIVDIVPLTCGTDEHVRIQVAGTNSFTVNTVSLTTVVPVSNLVGDDFVDVMLPTTGDYLFQVVDSNTGCIYPLPLHTVVDPQAPIVLISEAKPISCAIPGNDGALFITVDNYTGNYTYNVYEATDLTRANSLATGSASALSAAVNPTRVDNLPGGNLVVDIVAVDSPFCSAISNVVNIRTPNGVLHVTATEIGNVGCTNDSGEILAVGLGGWDTSSYDYRLLESVDNGLTYTNEIRPFSNTNSFTGLSFGFYQVEVRDSQLCMNSVEVELKEVPALLAGIREVQGLDCPNGNNAILETYDMTTGDEVTAIAGASGGVSGAGFNYKLLYLNGNDNTDVIAESGLQNIPTFTGDTGGFISQGWYAIEVSSSFGCSFVTEPYFVNPPPAIQPLLLQTRVPGCGGVGEVNLIIGNPDASFSYEYAPVEDGVVVGVYQAMNGTSALFTGVEGVTYQFDVRKVNNSNICTAIRSNGITMTNASGISLLANLPDDISCASELDGRIESFVTGGVGQDLFYLYEGDPIDAFNPSSTSTLIRGPQDDGTFENLSAGTAYYIAVTSGMTCMDIAGPFEIVRPEPIIFDTVVTNVSCKSEQDGSIAISVSQGGEGLIHFAIAPNFNEFFSDPDNPGTYVFDNLVAGDYEILIQDGNGCFEKDMITVTEPNKLLILDMTTTPESCTGSQNGTAVFEITGGTPFNDPAVSANPYYEVKVEMISPVDETGNGVFEPYKDEILEGLKGGATYVVYVRDVNECDATGVFKVRMGIELALKAKVEYGCDGIFPNNTTSLELENESLLPELMFALDPDDPSDAITSKAIDQYVWGDLEAGDHTVYVYHQNGCSTGIDFKIEDYNELTFEVDKTAPNEIVAKATGGFGEYEYFFNGESYGSDGVYTTSVSEEVEVRVVDAQGCELELNVPFEFTGMLEFPNFFSPDGDNLNEVWEPKNRELFEEVTVKIYDRYGRVVAVLDKVTNWNGTYEGKDLPTGDYWYVVNGKTIESRYVGHFTLYR